MKKTIFLSACGVLVCAAFVISKYWVFPRYDERHIQTYTGKYVQLEWVENIFRGSPKVYSLLTFEDGKSFYIDPLLQGETDQAALDQALNCQITICFDPELQRSAFGGMRIVAITGPSGEILTIESTNRAFREQRIIGVFFGTIIMIPMEVVAFFTGKKVYKKEKRQKEKRRKRAEQLSRRAQEQKE